MPNDWNYFLMFPVYKKGTKQNVKNSTAEVLCKVVAISIKEKLSDYSENILGDYLGGFRTNRSVVDQIFILKQLHTIYYEHNIHLYLLFIGFKKAYNVIKKYF